MTSQCVAHLLASLGVAKSLNRPHVSNDNPYSEAHFKTMKYSPSFPGRFGSEQDARGFCQSFFGWYNTEHYHVGLGLLTPETVHYGQVDRVRNQRKRVLLDAYAKNPERFVGGKPKLEPRPEAAWINRPTEQDVLVTAVH